METVASPPLAYDTTSVRPSDNALTENFRVNEDRGADELAFELGVWLKGASSFETACSFSFDGEATRSAERDRIREIRILHEALIRCSDLVNRLASAISRENADPSFAVRFQHKDLDELGSLIRRSVLLCDSMSTSRTTGALEWSALNSTVRDSIDSSRAVERLDLAAKEIGRTAIPMRLMKVFDAGKLGFADRFDLEDTVPRIGVILKSLSVVGTMLRLDEPVKPGLAVFAAVLEQVQRFIEHINSRLSLFPNEEAAMFNSLDSASYLVSLELKKVFRQELSGIVGVIPPTAVYAKVEAAHALLVNSFQQILVDLAMLIDGSLTAVDYFPSLQLKVDQSLILRDHLWQLLNSVKEAEQKPVEKTVAGLRKELTDFTGLTIRYLHYKDEETFERFSEEVHAARDSKDLVPILHRFGAYLETLFGQVCMRNVLASHPFEQKG